jgi:hypothetical protein
MIVGTVMLRDSMRSMLLLVLSVSALPVCSPFLNSGSSPCDMRQRVRQDFQPRSGEPA